MHLLLLSNSTMPGAEYLSWPGQYIADFLQVNKEALFVPYAAVTFGYNEYTTMVQQAFLPLGIKITGLHMVVDKHAALKNAGAIIVGGGNTFALLSRLQEEDLLAAIRQKVLTGTPYIGWSAGANLACPTIKTTNDMPITEPAAFEALNLIAFQINPHYTSQTIAGHGGESRQQRLREFLAMNPEMPVIGLPEGMLLQRTDKRWLLLGNGSEPAVWLQAGKEPCALTSGVVDLPL